MEVAQFTRARRAAIMVHSVSHKVCRLSPYESATPEKLLSGRVAQLAEQLTLNQ